MNEPMDINRELGFCAVPVSNVFLFFMGWENVWTHSTTPEHHIRN